MDKIEQSLQELIQELLQEYTRRAISDVYPWPLSEEDVELMSSHFIDINYFNGPRLLSESKSPLLQ